MRSATSEQLHDRQRPAFADGGSTARILRDDRCAAVAAALVDAAAALQIRGPLWQLHRTVSPRLCRGLGDALAVACRRPPVATLLDELCRDIGRAAFAESTGVDGALVRQAEPCVRVNPPRRPDLAVPFHTDGWAGNPRPQRALWIPVVDIVGDEGLWVCATNNDDDDVTRAWTDPGARLPGLQESARRASRPVHLVVGEALIFDADVVHGSVVHDVDRTRLSVDVRVAPAAAATTRGWRPRPL